MDRSPSIPELSLARDIIDLARQQATNASVLESLSAMCFSIDQLLDELGYKERRIHWHDLYNELDHNYYALQKDPAYQIKTRIMDREYSKTLQ